ncbi:nuclear transport factor 2 family protein [Rhodoblastus sp. 17X3]|uniref:nuclear transport factor 2 family protein n=1 Tax=Rhodoblastus sp. 17X3 TaxID=3047026 RepID=UPI0024B86A86|nr:nuclear transport factor 2 family protein [Rhodoblastus sp. 17X3]MDI9849802.1 nuclear transport factor 2 family protein [Rhodoblastus sp. 17X3]
MDNVQFVQSIYAAFARGDIDSVVAAFDSDIAWISNSDPALLPFGGERRGIEGVRSFFREQAANIEIDSYQPREFLCGLDFVAVLGRSISRSKVTDEPFEDDWLHLLRIRNGKVTEFRIFNDTHALVQAHYGGDIHSVTVAPTEATATLRR